MAKFPVGKCPGCGKSLDLHQDVSTGRTDFAPQVGDVLVCHGCAAIVLIEPKTLRVVPVDELGPDFCTFRQAALILHARAAILAERARLN